MSVAQERLLITMYTRRRALKGNRKYTKEFLESLVSSLQGCGFSRFYVKLPHNIVGTDNCQVDYGELIERERNYPSLIFIAENKQPDEVMKVLFINKSTKASFFDDTFPSGESEPPELYVSTQDPARTYGLFEYYYELLEKPGMSGFLLLWAISFLSFVVLMFEVLTVLSSRSTLFHKVWGVSPWWDGLASTVAVVLMFRYFAHPKGLWIKPRRDIRLLRLLAMAVRGDFRDNPLVALIVTIFGGVIAALILKAFGVIK